MSEGLAGETKWEDVNKGTFIRFAQFAYTGDYSAPKIIAKSFAQPEMASPLREEYFQWGKGASMKKVARKHISRSPSPTPRFEALIYSLPKPRFNFEDTCDTVISEGPNENIDEILLIHASLYVLAEKWGIDKLKRITLFKIHKTLSLFNLDTPKLQHVIRFVRYAYSDETTPDLETKIDDLRELICQYLAANAKFISRDATFLALIEEGGPLARDLWKIVGSRVDKSK